MLVLIIFYGLALSFLPTLSVKGTLGLHFVHALVWCIIHYFGLGLLLRAQSESKFLVRHYLKNYHYDYAQNDRGQNAIIEAFANWKTIYNLSMCMTYGTWRYHGKVHAFSFLSPW
jgi:phosphatidylethanolamine N-methyltransferase